VLFNSGISTVRGLEGLGRQALNPRLGRAVQSIYEDLRDGYSLAKAMARHPDIFSPIYISMVKAGEMSGAMGEILDRLATLLERELNLRKKVGAATPTRRRVLRLLPGDVHPGDLRVPDFVSLFQGIDLELPMITKSLIWLTSTIRNPC